MQLFGPLFDSLNAAGIRYVVVGGVATVLHGYAHLTADLDLVVDLDPVEARKAIECLVGIGLRPRPPVDPFDFADAKIRRSWIEQKSLRVFSLVDPANPLLVVDLFAEPPIPFETLWDQSEKLVIGSTTVRVASIPDLIAMKREAGRPKDLQDIEALTEIQRQRKSPRKR